MIKKLTLVLAVVLLTACAAVPRPSGVPSVIPSERDAAAPANPGTPPYDAWTRVLEQFVDAEGRVNFEALARNRTDLDRVDRKSVV